MNTDNLLLKLAGGKAIENGSCAKINTEEILNEALSQGVSHEDFDTSLRALGDDLSFGLDRVGKGIPSFCITVYGFERYMEIHIPQYHAIYRDVKHQIEEHNNTDNTSIASVVHQPLVVVNHVLNYWRNKS